MKRWPRGHSWRRRQLRADARERTDRAEEHRQRAAQAHEQLRELGNSGRHLYPWFERHQAVLARGLAAELTLDAAHSAVWDGPNVEPGAETWRAMDTINPPGRSPHWPAEAAASKAAALGNLEDDEPGPWWQHQASLPAGILSYELRPGGTRPGPAELWSTFDATVQELGMAMGRTLGAGRAARPRAAIACLARHRRCDCGGVRRSGRGGVGRRR